jgi:hypothetical protein
MLRTTPQPRVSLTTATRKVVLCVRLLRFDCGPAAGNAGYSEQQCSRAAAAALAEALFPWLILNRTVLGTLPSMPTQVHRIRWSHLVTISNRPLLRGVDFFCSSHSACRNKPAVVVTEGRTVKLTNGRNQNVAGKRGDFDLASLEEIRTTARMFVLVRETFDRAIKVVQGWTERRQWYDGH